MPAGGGLFRNPARGRFEVRRDRLAHRYGAHQQEVQLGPGRAVVAIEASIGRRVAALDRPFAADFDGAVLRDRVCDGGRDGLLQVAGFEEVEPGDEFVCLGERAIGDEGLVVADAHNFRFVGEGEAAAEEADALRVGVADPGSAIGLGRGGGSVAVDTDEDEVVHG